MAERDETEASLDALMARLSAGDRSAFDPLFRALHPRALRLARSRLPAPSADDAAQSALLKVFARAARFTPGRPALPWFYAIVANEIRSARRAERVRTVDDTVSSGAVHGDAQLDEELSQALRRAIDALDDDAAQAIRALLGEAPRPAISAQTFRKRVSRAYARLRLLMGEF